MNLHYIERTIESILIQMPEHFRALVLTGPRQSGKTTVLKRILGHRFAYVSLESLVHRARALRDPEGFLEINGPPLIIDEVQYAPQLMSYVKERIDNQPGAKGQYILTGSQNVLLAQGVTQSLSGRAVYTRLLPLSLRELAGQPQRELPWERSRIDIGADGVGYSELWRHLYRGGYPEPSQLPESVLATWFDSYVQTYLERDVRTLRQIGDLSRFQTFFALMAQRSGQPLNLTAVARAIGVAVNTVKAWLSVLEATYQILVVRPYLKNLGKRLVKAPKVYVSDTGLLCNLLGYSDARQAAQSVHSGGIVETAVLCELTKAFSHRGIRARIYTWRSAGRSRGGLSGGDRKWPDTGRSQVQCDVQGWDGAIH